MIVVAGIAASAADSQARVFRRGKVRSGEKKGAPLYYGCSLSTGHIQRLNRRSDLGLDRVTASTIRLAGRSSDMSRPASRR